MNKLLSSYDHTKSFVRETQATNTTI